MLVNRAIALERLKSGETLKECGNTMVFRNGDFISGWTDIYLRQRDLVKVTGGCAHLKYAWEVQP